MTVKIKRYIATIKIIDGDKVCIREVEIVGRRIRPQTVKKQIPENSILVSSGYMVRDYEVDKDELEKFLIANGKN